jgi:hypothetical protein
MEAKMRADLLHMASMRDLAESDLAESKRRNASLFSHLSEAKAKLSKAQQEKMQVERDQRATLALAKSLQQGGNNHSELDYYKRRVSHYYLLGLISGGGSALFGCLSDDTSLLLVS